MGQRLWQSGYLPIWIAALALFGCASLSLAQQIPAPVEPQAKAALAAPAAGDPLPGEVLPKVYYLKDKDGNLQAVPGFTFEQFMELYRLKNQLDQQNEQPRYSIQDLTLSGSAAGSRADLTAKYTVTVNAAGWVRVPLRLSDAVLRERPSYQGAGEHALHFEADGDGYVVWIRGEPGKTHQITLNLLASLTPIGPESHLRLNLPRCAVAQLDLQVPLARAVAKVSAGNTLESVAALEGGKTQLKIVGSGGELDLAWHAVESQVATLPTILEATGTQLIRINGRSVNTEAKLTVRSFGAEFDRFQVRLPPGADYVGAAQSGISLAAIEAAAGKGKLYEIKLDKKTTGPVEVRLVTERTHNSPQSEESLELAGFEVLGAVRQWGSVAVQVEGNWQLLWGEASHVRQVDELSGPLRRDDLAAGFEYFVQPYSLTARVSPQKTRVRVEPEYVLLVGSDQAQLRAKLKYTIRGAKVRALEIELPGWELDLIGPANLVNVDGAVSSQASPLMVPLLQATSGELELTLEAHQKINPATGTVALSLPRPHAEVIAPANVAVLAADNIELNVQADQTTGLGPQTVRLPLKQLPERQQEPLYFRAEGATPQFAATITTHEQAITAAITTQLDVDETETRIQQRMTFQVAYQPTDHLTLGVPRSLRADQLTITCDGQRLSPSMPAARLESDTQVVPMRLALPAARIGRCDLQVSYVVRHDKLANRANIPITVPLVIPGEGQLTANELIVTAKAGISVIPAKGPWREEPQKPVSSNGSGFVLTAPRALADVGLTLSSQGRPPENITTIERAWIQTRLTDAERQDRAVYRLTTTDTRLKIALPAGVDLGSVELQIDGRGLTPELDRQRELIIVLPGGGRSEHLLDLRYHFTERQPSGPLSLACPQVISAGWTQQLYWQLVLPAYEHLLFAPVHFTPENSWVWSDFFWQRRPPLDERELESWLGASPSNQNARVPNETDEQFAARQQKQARSTNQYLFSTVGSVVPLEVYTQSRTRLVLSASLPVLIFGLLLIYFPSFRHPAVLFAAAVLIAIGSFVEPESALLLAQAATLGFVLAILAALMARVSTQPAVPATPVMPVRGSSKSMERTATELYQRAPTGGSQPGTTTTPLVSTSPPESET